MTHTIINTEGDLMIKNNKQLNKFTQELRRGTITIAVLSQLFEKQYGYSLVTRLNERGIDIEPGTLYPLLRRLEKQGLLKSEWDTDEARPRKYYSLSEAGEKTFNLLINEWQNIVDNLNQLINRKGDDKNDND